VSAAPARKGRVILLGAGPGDPDLVTVRGMNALCEADAVVYDALAPKELLDLVPPGAELHNVGKRGHDEPTRPQPEITALLVQLAREGKTVVRLKGGDPFVFGRGGEEATACAEAGLDFEVIPGISSAIGALAYAGIPVTDRRYAASFAVVTGHKDPTRVSEETRWGELATAVDTLVILMGMRKLEELVERLLAGGRDPKTPAAVVMNGTLPAQRVVEAPLGAIARRAEEAGLGAPAAIVIGDVVRLRETLAWFERRPLFGKRVLVTREERQSGRMVRALRDAGAEAVVRPMIRLVPPDDWAEVDAALDAIASYDAVLITSANAIRFLAGRAEARGVSLTPPGLQVLCVGPQTANATRDAGVPVHRIPESRYDADGLLDEITKHLPPRGRRFLFPRAEGAREVLPRGLASAGAQVDSVTLYRTLPPAIDAAEMRALLLDEGLDALTFTSPSTVENFVALLDDESRAAAGRCIVAVIGPVTAEALRREGFAPDVTAERASVPDLVAALADRMSGGTSGDAGGSR
jgi:uroporphyrinogen III methyltransferase/synthase